jgi:hypothetical protein
VPASAPPPRLDAVGKLELPDGGCSEDLSGTPPEK